MKFIKSLLILVPFLATSAFAGKIPAEIYQPKGQLIKSVNKGNEYEVEYHLKGNDVRELAKKAKAHAKKHGFRIVEDQVWEREADLKFVRDGQVLEVDIEVERGYIEYKAELERY